MRRAAHAAARLCKFGRVPVTWPSLRPDAAPFTFQDRAALLVGGRHADTDAEPSAAALCVREVFLGWQDVIGGIEGHAVRWRHGVVRHQGTSFGITSSFWRLRACDIFCP